MDDLTLSYIGRLLHNARRTTPVTLKGYHMDWSVIAADLNRVHL